MTSEMLAAPFVFSPRIKRYVWGGRRLAALPGRDRSHERIAESWEISAHPSGATPVADGPLEGRDPAFLLKEFGEALVGLRGRDAVQTGRFPLLIKLLDAAQPLSVQVHPGDALAQAKHGESGKTEAWHILEAAPETHVICGLREGVDRTAAIRLFGEGRAVDCLERIPIRSGDTVLVPAGTVHSILPSVLLVEVQQSSDVTYRLYDWDRGGEAERPLHVQDAIAAINFGRTQGAGKTTPLQRASSAGIRREELARSPHFVLERFVLDPGAFYAGEARGETLEIWGALKGEARIASTGQPRDVALPAVRFALFPASMGSYRVGAGGAAPLEALRVYLPKK